jgi:hypothetical protein
MKQEAIITSQASSLKMKEIILPVIEVVILLDFLETFSFYVKMPCKYSLEN